MEKLDWALLPTFLAVMETGSHSAAARKLGLSQPTVGRHIEALEISLNLKLFVPVAKGFDATPAAVAIHESALDMNAKAKEIDRLATGLEQKLAGSVRLSASAVVSTYILPTVLAKFQREFPDIQVELISSNETQNLRLREADVAVRMVQPTQEELIAKKLGELPIKLYASEQYLAGKPSFEPAGLLSDEHNFLGYDQSDLIIEGFKRQGLKVRKSDFCFRTDDQVAFVEACAAGMGIAPIVVPIAHRKGLKQVPGTEAQGIPSLPVWLVTHSEVRSNPRIRALFDWLSTHLLEGL